MLFDNALYQAELASRTSTIAGILWHQGESDCFDDLYSLYEEKFTKILDGFQKALNLYDVPILLGGLGDFLKDCPIHDELKNYVYVNNSLKQIADKRSMIGYVSAEGLGANPDKLHFSAKALREFGIRYYKKFLELEDKNKVFVEKCHPDDAIRTEMELL